jgi:hypothetical protein
MELTNVHNSLAQAVFFNASLKDRWFMFVSCVHYLIFNISVT